MRLMLLRNRVVEGWTLRDLHERTRWRRKMMRTRVHHHPDLAVLAVEEHMGGRVVESCYAVLFLRLRLLGR